MILHINHVADWRYIRQHKQMHINNDVTHENTTIINHSYKVGDKILIKNRSSYKYKTPFIGPNEKNQTWTKGNVTLRTGTITHKINICNIKPHNDADVE